MSLALTTGQRHDIIKAHDLIVDLHFERIITDRGDSATNFRNRIRANTNGMESVIPPKQNPKEPHAYDAWLYRRRHLIECFIGKIKPFRRAFSRFDKLAQRYLGFLHSAGLRLRLR